MFNAAERKQMIREFFFDEAEDFWRLSKNPEDRNPGYRGEERDELHGYSTNNLYSTLSDPNGIGPNQSTKSAVLAPKNSTEEYEEGDEPEGFTHFKSII